MSFSNTILSGAGGGVGGGEGTGVGVGVGLGTGDGIGVGVGVGIGACGAVCSWQPIVSPTDNSIRAMAMLRLMQFFITPIFYQNLWDSQYPKSNMPWSMVLAWCSMSVRSVSCHPVICFCHRVFFNRHWDICQSSPGQSMNTKRVKLAGSGQFMTRVKIKQGFLASSLQSWPLPRSVLFCPP